MEGVNEGSTTDEVEIGQIMKSTKQWKEQKSRNVCLRKSLGW